MYVFVHFLFNTKDPLRVILIPFLLIVAVYDDKVRSCGLLWLTSLLASAGKPDLPLGPRES